MPILPLSALALTAAGALAPASSPSSSLPFPPPPPSSRERRNPRWPRELWDPRRHGRRRCRNEAARLLERVLAPRGENDEVDGLGTVLLSVWHAARGKTEELSPPARLRCEAGWHRPDTLPPPPRRPEALRICRDSLRQGWPVLLLDADGLGPRASLVTGFDRDGGILRIWSPHDGTSTRSLDGVLSACLYLGSAGPLVRRLHRPPTWLDPRAHPLEAARAREDLAALLSRRPPEAGSPCIRSRRCCTVP